MCWLKRENDCVHPVLQSRKDARNRFKCNHCTGKRARTDIEVVLEGLVVEAEQEICGGVLWRFVDVVPRKMLAKSVGTAAQDGAYDLRIILILLQKYFQASESEY